MVSHSPLRGPREELCSSSGTTAVYLPLSRQWDTWKQTLLRSIACPESDINHNFKKEWRRFQTSDHAHGKFCFSLVQINRIKNILGLESKQGSTMARKYLYHVSDGTIVPVPNLRLFVPLSEDISHPTEHHTQRKCKNK